MLKHLPTVWQILPEAVQLELKTKVLEDTKALCGGTRWVGQVGMVKSPFLPNHGASRKIRGDQIDGTSGVLPLATHTHTYIII